MAVNQLISIMNNHVIAIDVKGLCKSFNSIKAVKDLSLKIYTGSIFGFLGANGSGKSTSLRLLCGLLMPDGGEGNCLGFNLFTETKKLQAEVGYMPQRFSLYRNLTVYENLDFIGRIYSLRNRKKRLREILDVFAFKEREHQLAHTLSGGWQQRLSLAAAIFHAPRLLILDEPTTGIDPQSRMLIWDYIQGLTKKGVTILMSTHHMDEAELCHQLVYMANGNILVRGSVDEVIETLGLSTWRVTGKNLAQIANELKKNPAFVQVIEKGHEIRISALKRAAAEKELAKIGEAYQVRETETLLEDVFIFYIRERGKQP